MFCRLDSDLLLPKIRPKGWCGQGGAHRLGLMRPLRPRTFATGESQEEDGCKSIKPWLGRTGYHHDLHAGDRRMSSAIPRSANIAPYRSPRDEWAARPNRLWSVRWTPGKMETGRLPVSLRRIVERCRKSWAGLTRRSEFQPVLVHTVLRRSEKHGVGVSSDRRSKRGRLP